MNELITKYMSGAYDIPFFLIIVENGHPDPLKPSNQFLRPSKAPGPRGDFKCYWDHQCGCRGGNRFKKGIQKQLIKKAIS